MKHQESYEIFSTEFWFGQIGTRTLSVFRVGFSILLLKDAIYHIALARWFYSDVGITPRQVIIDTSRSTRFSLMDALPEPWMAAIFFLLWIIILLNLLVGHRTKLMTILNFIFILSVHERNLWLIDGADNILRNLSFWIMFFPLNHYYSVDAIRRRWQQFLRTRNLADLRAPSEPQTTYAFPVRMAQVQVLIVYVMATVLKLPSSIWQDGEALYYALQIETLVLPTGRFVVTNFPFWTMQILAYISLFIEGTMLLWVYSPFWQPYSKAIGLALGSLFHLGIAFLMAIPNFSWVMINSYWLFAEDGWVEWLERKLRPANMPIQTALPPPGDARWLLLSVTTSDDVQIGGNAQVTLYNLLAYLPLSRLWLNKTTARLSENWLTILSSRQFTGQATARAANTEVPTSLPPNPLTLPSQAFRTVILAIMMVLVIWWNVSGIETPSGEPPIPYLEGPPRSALQYTGMWQGWTLFAPYPSTFYGWITVHGTFEDGSQRELRTDSPIVEGEPLYWWFGPNNRWSKFEDELQRAEEEELLLLWGRYYCREYNENMDLPEGERLATLEIAYYHRATHGPGEPENEFTSRWLWRHWCLAEYAPGNSS